MTVAADRSDFVARFAVGYQPDDPLDRAAYWRHLELAVRSELDAAVVAARRLDPPPTWRQVGELLGMAGPSAHKRFARKVAREG